jgi:hypothetical protein
MYQPVTEYHDESGTDNCDKSRMGATSGRRFQGLAINQFDSSGLKFKLFAQVLHAFDPSSSWL